MKVQVNLSAQELKRMRLKKVNPYAIVTFINGKLDGQEVGRTETWVSPFLAAVLSTRMIFRYMFSLVLFMFSV